MSALILDGRAIAQDVLEGVRERVQALADRGVGPQLVFVAIGESPPARQYVRRLRRLGESAGVTVTLHHLAQEIGPEDLALEIGALNADGAVDGILIQMPLPEQLKIADLSPLIDPRKDVDGITIQNAGRLYLGLQGNYPSTAVAMMDVLDWAGVDAIGKHAVVVGRSQVVGHPVAELLLQRDATVTVAHRQTGHLGEVTRLADILLVAAGSPGLIRPGMVKSGVVILDAGINVTGDVTVGDVAPSCADIAGMMTPVPGGIGPVTNAVLLRAVIESAERRAA